MIYNMEQGTQEWLDIRLGKITASRVVDIVQGTKGKYLASRKNYMAEIACEILTDKGSDNFVSGAMQWGTDTEPLARSAYEAISGNMVYEVGFIDNDQIKGLGASPDGLIDDNGCIEIKCPNTATHIETLTGKAIDRKYQYQMQTVMLCGNRAWCDFISYDPRLPDNMSIFIKRFNRDEVMVKEIEAECIKFIAELDEMLEKLRGI